MKLFLICLFWLPFFASAQDDALSHKYAFETPVEKITLGEAPLRETPYPSRSLLLTIPKGKTVKLTGLYEGYYRALYGNEVGFLHYIYIDGDLKAFSAINYLPKGGIKGTYDFENEPNEAIRFGKVNFSSPLKRAPSSYSDTLYNIPVGIVFKVTHYNENYWRADVNGKVGYLGKAYLVHASKTYKEAREYLGMNYAGERSTKQIMAEVDEVLKESNKVLKWSNNVKLYRGPRGGCYYITGSGRKQYVDRSLCN
ncbi:hypothetical protein GO730_03735 [Spirosoma sp. HMF3257]|uniref:SH3 domain-containing protein n=1 Tax=Spirosoma telluris TaxID=2183553 RepID=A0A327NEI0_9BACT|nr:hypothetical protein [Spirosoma telluris]RAI73731.1 hypothetical protein HMF3257_03670 [Spirosoma telluris]